MFSPSHLAISQIDDVSNWKAWNILEQSMERGSHTSTSLGCVPNGKKKVWSLFWKRNKGASFGMVQAVLVTSWLSISKSFLEGPGVKSEDRYMGVFVPRF